MGKRNLTADPYAMRPIDVELYETCAEGTFAQVKALLDKGADPNAIHWKVYKHNDGTASGDDYYCIHEAARNHDIRVFDLLVEHGANPCQRDFWDAEPLSYAAHKNSLAMIKHLVELGNDPNLCDMDGQTVIGNAALNPDLRVVEFLLEHGARLDYGALDASELGRAIRNGTPERVRFFIEKGSRMDGDVPYFSRWAPLRNLRVLFEHGFDPNSSENGLREVRVVDLLDPKRKALFLEHGAVPFFKKQALCIDPYDRGLPLTGNDFEKHAKSFFPYMGATRTFGRKRMLKGNLTEWSHGVDIVIESKTETGLPVAERVHFILRETRKACRDDFCRVSPFFKVRGKMLWHARLDYGDVRTPLSFVVANAFQGDGFDTYSKGGVFRMRFMGLGESLECLNNRGVIRFWGGNPVARERRDKGAPSIDHVDMVVSTMRALNSCGDTKNPAFAEFTSTIENVSRETICGQPCYRIRLWSGPLDSPSSFPWTLLIAKMRVQKGYIPRVGDFVNGIAAMYGTFDEVADGEPTVFEPEFEGGDPEPPIPEKDVPEPPKGKPESEWLPRRPMDYPKAPAPRVPLPAFTDEPFKKFVTYPEYRQHLGEMLVPVAPPSRKRLRAIIDEIDHVITTDGNRRVFAPHFDAIGIRHAVRDPSTGETHLWLCIPWFSRWCERHGDLLVTVSGDGYALRYSIHTGDERWAHGEWESITWAFKKGSRRTNFDTPSAALSAIPDMKKDDFIILSGQCHGSLFQAACTRAGQRHTFLVEIQIFGMEWQFFKKNVTEKRLLELCHLFLDGGLVAVENEEPWKQVRMKNSY